MTEQDAKQLKVNDWVMWDGNPDDIGRVFQVEIGGVCIHWNDGYIGWIAYQDCFILERVDNN